MPGSWSYFVFGSAAISTFSQSRTGPFTYVSRSAGSRPIPDVIVASWTSVIGGETYRGTCYPDIVGWHFYTDYGAGGLYRARLQSNGMLEKVTVSGSFPGSVSSIHADARGELYMTTTGGYVHHLEAGP